MVRSRVIGGLDPDDGKVGQNKVYPMVQAITLKVQLLGPPPNSKNSSPNGGLFCFKLMIQMFKAFIKQSCLPNIFVI